MTSQGDPANMWTLSNAHITVHSVESGETFISSSPSESSTDQGTSTWITPGVICEISYERQNCDCEQRGKVIRWGVVCYCCSCCYSWYECNVIFKSWCLVLSVPKPLCSSFTRWQRETRWRCIVISVRTLPRRSLSMGQCAWICECGARCVFTFHNFPHYWGR